MKKRLVSGLIGLAVKLLVGQVKKAAEGKYGKAPAAAYWWLVGRKTAIGLGLLIGAGTLAWLGGYTGEPMLSDYAAKTFALGGLLVQAGLLDKAWRGNLPGPLVEHPAYRFVASHHGEVATVFGLAFAALRQWACGTWCDYAEVGLIIVGGVFVQLGLLDELWRAEAPEEPIARRLKRELRELQG